MPHKGSSSTQCPKKAKGLDLSSCEVVRAWFKERFWTFRGKWFPFCDFNVPQSPHVAHLIFRASMLVLDMRSLCSSVVNPVAKGQKLWFQVLFSVPFSVCLRNGMTHQEGPCWLLSLNLGLSDPQNCRKLVISCSPQHYSVAINAKWTVFFSLLISVDFFLTALCHVYSWMSDVSAVSTSPMEAPSLGVLGEKAQNCSFGSPLTRSKHFLCCLAIHLKPEVNWFSSVDPLLTYCGQELINMHSCVCSHLPSAFFFSSGFTAVNWSNGWNTTRSSCSRALFLRDPNSCFLVCRWGLPDTHTAEHSVSSYKDTNPIHENCTLFFYST